MAGRSKELGQRIATLRRRHYGARGKARFAERLGLTAEAYAAFERGQIPTGDVLVKMCELTGEDLQWLLTGVAARGTMVIAGTRGRHQAVVARLIEALERQPELATPVEAFLDLLLRSEEVRAKEPALPGRAEAGLIPIYGGDETPLRLPGPDDGPDGVPLLRDAEAETVGELLLDEPLLAGGSGEGTRVSVVGSREDRRQYLDNPRLAQALPQAFAVRIEEDAMAPMFARGDLALVTPSGAARVGRPAVCRLSAAGGVCCRIWLGESAGRIRLGRVQDHGEECLAPAVVAWALEAVYRLRPAA
jgi:transcriptional regulator with XRE-family HTH domain